MKWWMGLVAVVVVGALFRFWQLGRVPTGVYWDEVAMLVDIKAVLATGHDMHGNPWQQVIYPSYGDYKLAPYIWSALLVSKVVGVSELALRLPSALAGVATILLVAGLAFEVGERIKLKPEQKGLLALLCAVLVATSPWAIQFSRQAFEGHLAQALFLLGVWGQLRWQHTRQWGWLAVSVLAGVAATYTYFSVRYVWVGVWLLTWWLDQIWPKSGKSMTKQIAFAVVPIVVFGLLLLPQLNSRFYKDMYTFRLGSDSVLKTDYWPHVAQTRLASGNTILSKVAFNHYTFAARELARHYADHFSLEYLFITGDPNLRHSAGYGLLLWPLLPFFLLGFLMTLKERPKLWLYLVGWWVWALLPASVPANTPHALRSLNALFPLMALTSFGLFEVWEWLSEQKRVPLIARRGVVGLFLLGFVLVFAQYWIYYLQVYPTVAAKDWQRGFPEVARAVGEFRQGRPTYIWIDDDRFFLWLMAYGPYKGDEFKQWKSEQYQFLEFDNVWVSRFRPWEDLVGGGQEVVVVGTSQTVKTVLDDPTMNIIKQQQITVPGRSEVYELVAFARKK
jgi:4-amino-4-deoxy-L-arabinose transferase-like glycosyltransferase